MRSVQLERNNESTFLLVQCLIIKLSAHSMAHNKKAVKLKTIFMRETGVCIQRRRCLLSNQLLILYKFYDVSTQSQMYHSLNIKLNTQEH